MRVRETMDACAQVLQSHFRSVPNAVLQIRVGWAVQKDQIKEDTSGHPSIFVGDLSNDVNDRALFEAFQACEGCSNARVMWDHATNRSTPFYSWICPCESCSGSLL